MRRATSKFLPLLIAFFTAGAQTVCACPPAAPAPQATAPATKICAGPGTCCKKDLPKDDRPKGSDDRCDHCNLKNQVSQTQPGTENVALKLHPAFDLTPISFVAIAPAIDARASGPVTDGVPAPPMMNDLFHAHSLLLN
jgi:hypothetical protein